ncbi:MAG: hypothetical protein Q9195_008928 [Heterodermia aff. obscurata]
MSGNWTPGQDQDLIMAVVMTRAPVITKGEWVTISKKLGHGKTAEACRQHFSRLMKISSGNLAAGTKRKADDDGEGASAETGSEDAGSSENPADAAAKTKSKGKAKEAASPDTASEEAGSPEKPAKAPAKPKAKAKAKEGGVKVKAARGGKESGTGRGGKAAGTGRGGKKAKTEPVKEVPEEEEAGADEFVEKGTFVPKEDEGGNEEAVGGNEAEKVDEI